MTGAEPATGIVVGVDGSDSSSAALRWAARTAEMRNVALKVVYVIAPFVPAGASDFPGPADYMTWQEDEAGEVLQNSLAIATEASSPGRESQISTEVLHGPIVPNLVELSKSADLIVVGRRGMGAVARTLLGSTSSSLIRHAHCPVAVIHEEDPANPLSPDAPVVVGVDGSPASELATGIAFDEASRRGVDLVAVHAWSDMPLEFGNPRHAPTEWTNLNAEEQEVLGERLAGWHERYPDVVVHKTVATDRPVHRILAAAEKAQLIVVGSHGRGGFAGMFLGSVGRSVVNSAQIPVIVARQA